MKLLPLLLVTVMMMGVAQAITIGPGVMFTTQNVTWNVTNNITPQNISIGQNYLVFENDNLSFNPSSSSVNVSIINWSGPEDNNFSLQSATQTINWGIVGQPLYYLTYDNTLYNSSFTAGAGTNYWQYSAYSLAFYAKDALTNTPLNNVNVTLYGTTNTYQIEIDDEKIFPRIDPGFYNYIVTGSGLDTLTGAFTKSAGEMINQTFYLSSDAQDVTILVRNEFSQFLSDASITIIRSYDGAIIETATTDFSGASQFNLLSELQYTVNITKNGYANYSEPLTPTTTEYTITLESLETNTPSYFSGVNHTFSPNDGTLLDNGTVYTFGFDFETSLWNATNCYFFVRGDENGLLNSSKNFCTGQKGDSDLKANVANNEQIKLFGTISLNGTNVTYKQVYDVRENYQGNFSLMTMADDIGNFNKSGFGDWGRMFIAIMAIAGITIWVISKSDIFGEPERIMLLILSLTGLFSYVNWMNLNFLANDDLNQWGIFGILFIINVGFYLTKTDR